jgi:hypothetical protein
MNFEEFGPKEVSIQLSHEHLKEAIRNYLYTSGYSTLKKGESIAEVTFGALTEGLIPIHYWVEKEISEESEVFIQYNNGKSS